MPHALSATFDHRLAVWPELDSNFLGQIPHSLPPTPLKTSRERLFKLSISRPVRMSRSLNFYGILKKVSSDKWTAFLGPGCRTSCTLPFLPHSSKLRESSTSTSQKRVLWRALTNKFDFPVAMMYSCLFFSHDRVVEATFRVVAAWACSLAR